MNMNDRASVVLTKVGANILNDREEYYSNIIPYYNKKQWSDGDKYDTQLWCLFKIFNQYIDITCETPFKLNEITIKENH